MVVRLGCQDLYPADTGRAICRGLSTDPTCKRQAWASSRCPYKPRNPHACSLRHKHGQHATNMWWTRMLLPSGPVRAAAGARCAVEHPGLRLRCRSCLLAGMLENGCGAVMADLSCESLTSTLCLRTAIRQVPPQVGSSSCYTSMVCVAAPQASEGGALMADLLMVAWPASSACSRQQLDTCMA